MHCSAPHGEERSPFSAPQITGAPFPFLLLASTRAHALPNVASARSELFKGDWFVATRAKASSAETDHERRTVLAELRSEQTSVTARALVDRRRFRRPGGNHRNVEAPLLMPAAKSGLTAGVRAPDPGSTRGQCATARSTDWRYATVTRRGPRLLEGCARHDRAPLSAPGCAQALPVTQGPRRGPSSHQ